MGRSGTEGGEQTGEERMDPACHIAWARTALCSHECTRGDNSVQADIVRNGKYRQESGQPRARSKEVEATVVGVRDSCSH